MALQRNALQLEDSDIDNKWLAKSKTYIVSPSVTQPSNWPGHVIDKVIIIVLALVVFI